MGCLVVRVRENGREVVLEGESGFREALLALGFSDRSAGLAYRIASLLASLPLRVVYREEGVEIEARKCGSNP